MSSYVKSVKSRRIGPALSGNKGVWVWRRRLGKYVSLDHPNGMKLEESQMRRIVRQKRKGSSPMRR